MSASHPFLRRAAVELVSREEPPVGPIRRDRLRHRGSIILRDQSACPFRAFARNRLHVEPQRRPHRYPDPAERGTAIHAALRALFQRLGDQIDDAALDDAVTERALTHAIDVATAALGSLPPAFIESERARLRRLLAEWLQVERERVPLQIVAIERATTLPLGDFEFDLRVDRVDDTSNDIVVVDYKTGEVAANAVFGERLEEPQLPMYALATPGATAIALAAILTGDCRLVGWSQSPFSSRSIRFRRPTESEGDWNAMMTLWRRRLTDLTDEFVAGITDVRPRDAKACRECDLHALCRIREIERIAAD
ncbi:MAG TPA: PD-(D/E)XK nuclease family protein [Pseudomonadales bacterium]|nr:PD-(D/E)XK nuclease family protein [Pseudomonadales bacterium]